MFSQQIPDLVFDVDALRSATNEVYGMVAPRETRRGVNVLRAVNLTHRPGSSDPFHEGSVSRRLDTDAGAPQVREADYSEFNRDLEKTYFYEVYRSLPFAVGRMRLISLPPSTIYRVHVDTSDRAHIAITTNPYARLVSGAGDTFHVPVNGGVYRIHTRGEHTAYNAGPADRLHLVMSMSDTEG